MQVISVIHEGCTEEIYLRHLLKLLKIQNTSTLEFHNVQGGGPIKLLEKFTTLISDTERNHVKNYLFIMDSDKLEHDDIRATILSYKKDYTNFSVISFNPCIEMLFIAHFEDNINQLQEKAFSKILVSDKILKTTRTKPINVASPCKQSVKYLKFYHIAGYSKANCLNKFQTFIDIPQIQKAHKQCISLQDLVSYIKITA